MYFCERLASGPEMGDDGYHKRQREMVAVNIHTLREGDVVTHDYTADGTLFIVKHTVDMSGPARMIEYVFADRVDSPGSVRALNPQHVHLVAEEAAGAARNAYREALQ